MDLLRKTFGGLNGSYFFRHLFFGMAISVFFIWLFSKNPNANLIRMMIFSLISGLLYPYARFVYEQITGFLMGENVFFGNAIFMLAIKLITMILCWAFAIFIAPVGLTYLYFHHTRQEKIKE
ncbi:hypothetical protein [Xenorhabdus griffiniae]|uniref:Colicin transporter n=1 Tax=Xenorhabdus griffiniae TaxID=351672 RepID=A0ABY9XN07_9GAMM|nr:hypothetical protein [Xenorhabdus griffiniae]MBD1226400.1 hypothetical protein [Xenorhabdus griffiniae]MBE8588719.1 hypothetical protein [Xenorhabdus griffiniae]WMV74342.1 hypothetical protein QL128_10285 [Xenorhabdus griffiniae]WNH04022.1 hypothetical protein QL112_010290 [Xenorhabdus griffiniae]